MASIASRIDGQTIGVSLTAPTVAVDIVSLNIVSGALTSGVDSSGVPFLSDVDLRNLAPAVEALFSLVPSAQRAAGALTMLQRLVTLAPAAAASLSQTAPNVGSVYTLRATISAAPSQFVAHLPFSADGTIAWATGIDVVGTGTVTSVTASSPLASSGGATPNITITSPLPTANGGTAVAATGASNGLFGVGGGVGGLTPLVYANTTIGVEAADTIPVAFQLRNGTSNYTAQLAIWGQIVQGTLAGITLSAGAAGQVIPMGDFATSGRFVMISSAAGVINLNVNNAAAEMVGIGYGPGPGTDQIFLGGQFDLTFA